MKKVDILQDSFYEKEKRKEAEYRSQFKPGVQAYKSKPVNTRRLLFFDLLLIIILMGVIYPFISSRFGPDRWSDGYHYVYSGVVLQNSIIHNLEVKARDNLKGDPPLMEVTFHYGDENEGTTQVDLAPQAGQRRSFSLEQDLSELPEKMVCQVEINGEIHNFSRQLGRISYFKPIGELFKSLKE